MILAECITMDATTPSGELVELVKGDDGHWAVIYRGRARGRLKEAGDLSLRTTATWVLGGVEIPLRGLEDPTPDSGWGGQIQYGLATFLRVVPGDDGFERTDWGSVIDALNHRGLKGAPPIARKEVLSALEAQGWIYERKGRGGPIFCRPL